MASWKQRAISELSPSAWISTHTGHLTFNAANFKLARFEWFMPLHPIPGEFFIGVDSSGHNRRTESRRSRHGHDQERRGTADIALSKLNTKINDEVDYINNFQQNLLTQLAQSDAAIYQLEQQNTFYTGLFNTNNNSNGN